MIDVWPCGCEGDASGLDSCGRGERKRKSECSASTVQRAIVLAEIHAPKPGACLTLFAGRGHEAITPSYAGSRLPT